MYWNSVEHNRPQLEAQGNKPHKLCSYPPEPRTVVYCFRLNFNISKLVYYKWTIIASYSKLLQIKGLFKKMCSKH